MQWLHSKDGCVSVARSSQLSGGFRAVVPALPNQHCFLYWEYTWRLEGWVKDAVQSPLLFHPPSPAPTIP